MVGYPTIESAELRPGGRVPPRRPQLPRVAQPHLAARPGDRGEGPAARDRAGLLAARSRTAARSSCCSRIRPGSSRCTTGRWSRPASPSRPTASSAPPGQGVQRRVPAVRAGRVAAVLGDGHGGGGPGAAEPRLRAAEAGGLRHDVSDLGAALRARGMRLTPQRRRIVDALTSLEHGTPGRGCRPGRRGRWCRPPAVDDLPRPRRPRGARDRLAHASGPPGADLPPRRPRHPHPPGLPGLRDRLRGSDRDGRRVRRECPGRYGL